MTAADLMAWSAATAEERIEWKDEEMLNELIEERKRELAQLNA